MKNISTPEAAGSLENKYKFNGGNELQHNEFSDGSGLDVYDAVHRMYDPQLGVFHQKDLLAEFTYNISSYVFSHDNPISLNDPFGLTDTVTIPLPTVVVKSSQKEVSAKNMNKMHYNELSIWVDRQRSRGASPEQIQDWARNNNYLTSNTIDKILSASNRLSIAIRDDQKVYWETQGKVYAALLELLAAEFGGEVLAEFLTEADEAIAVEEAGNLSNAELKAVSTLEKRIAEHEEKLLQYIKNPEKFDNKGFLKNAPSNEIRQKIIQSRIKHLQQEINTFKDNIYKIINK